MSIYSWKEMEAPLDGGSCVAVSVEIEELNKVDESYTAKGTITAKDYVEHGIVFTEPWEATYSQDAKQPIWTVRRVHDAEAFWIDQTTGEAHFTANRIINDGIKKFVAQKLNHFLALRASGRELPIVEHAAVFTDERTKYEGPCMCSVLAKRNDRDRAQAEPFDRHSLLSADQFPENCFACSCGKNWWCYNDTLNLWAPVADAEAWEMLLQHNGVPVQSIEYVKIPEKGLDGMVLLQTMRNMGFIPL